MVAKFGTVIKKNFSNKSVIFIFAFLLMFISLCNTKTLLFGGDANETWKVVSTFFSNNPESSYVMYKGILAFLPGIISYNVGNFFDFDKFLVLKIFNAMSFAYLATVGIPYLLEYLMKEKTSVYKRYIFIIVFFIILGYLFKFISVDFLSLMLLILTINSFIKIVKNIKTNRFYYLYSGGVFASVMLLSGQYSLSAIIMLIYLITNKTIPSLISLNKKNILNRIIIIVIFLLGYSIVTATNTYFVEKRVEPVRESGVWLPTNEDWLRYGLMAHMTKINYPAMISDNRGLSIIKKENIPLETILNGGYVTDYLYYSKLIAKYPVDFVLRWSDRFFLGTVNDPRNSLGIEIFGDGGNAKESIKNLNFWSLYIMLTFIFVSLVTIKQKAIKIKDFANAKTLVVLAIVVAAIVPSILGHIENRYFMGIQALIIATAILSNTMWDPLIKFIKNIKDIKIGSILDSKVNYTVVTYLIFMLICFCLYGAIYENMGVDTSILFN